MSGRIKRTAGMIAGLGLLALARLTAHPAPAAVSRSPDPLAPRRLGLRRILAWFGLFVGAEAILGALVVVGIASAGLYDVAATAGHPPIVRWFLHYTMRHSVFHHAPTLPAPNLDDPGLIALGATHYRDSCAPCHGAPGERASPLAHGMTPTPPALYSARKDFSPDELHWIVKHGVKMTAMPAWPAPARDDEVWAMVAFLRVLPALTPETYQPLANGAASAGPDLPREAPAVAATCARCHGPGGNGRGGRAPKLAGLSRAYIAQSLREFRDGLRPSGFMQPVAADLDDPAIAQLADYFSQQNRQAQPAPPLDPATRALAVKLAEPGHGPGPACGACHGNGAGDPANLVPDLDGQPASYLAAQLRLFRSGQRASTSAAQAMVRIARHLDDREIDAVARYLAGAR